MTSRNPHRIARKAIEPWFKAWLILAPAVGLGSYYLTRNSWRRIRAMAQGEAGSIWDAPPVPEIAEPLTFTHYGLAATLIFTLFWFVIARLYIRATRPSS